MSNISDVIIKSPQNNKVSSMVLAMQGWEKSLDTSSGQAGSQFGRVVEIRAAGLTITNELDVEFTVPFDDDTEPNEAEIRVYNLTQSTIAKLKPNVELTITAGYRGDTGIIFSGVISDIQTKWTDFDKLTTIHAVDCIKLNERDVDSISFKAGTKASYILETLVGQLNLPIAVFETEKDFEYTEAVTVSGNLLENIKQYAEVCGVTAYIHKRKVYVRNIMSGDDLGFTVTVDTGLIGSPTVTLADVDDENHAEEEETNTVSFKMLLEHRIGAASVINLRSIDVKGRYRVRSGRHTCNESDFYTEITAIEG